MHKHIYITKNSDKDNDVLPCAACGKDGKVFYSITTDLLQQECLSYLDVCYNCIRPFLKILPLMDSKNHATPSP